MSDLKRIEEERKKGEEMEKKIRRWILPWIILILIITFWFSFEKPSNIENPDSDVHEFSTTFIIGKNYSYNFSNQLISLIKEKNTSAPYTFYIGSGFLPPGLSLSEGGILAGKPTGNGGTFTFEVCVTDVYGNFASRKYQLNVASEIDESLNTNEETSGILAGDKPCPVTSCDWECCGHVTHNGGDMPDSTMIAFAVYDYCDCPSDTTFLEMQDIGDPSGRMYKMCLCNDY